MENLKEQCAKGYMGQEQPLWKAGISMKGLASLIPPSSFHTGKQGQAKEKKGKKEASREIQRKGLE